MAGVGFTLPHANSEYTIPEWIKNVAGLWHDGQISDTEFVKGIEYLIKNDVIVINALNEADTSDNVTLVDSISDSKIKISVHTNKIEYGPNDVVMIFGLVNKIMEGHEVGIVISDFKGKILAIAKISPNSDGSYGFVAEQPMFREFGEYTVNVYYGGQAYDHTTYTYKPKI